MQIRLIKNFFFTLTEFKATLKEKLLIMLFKVYF